ncbi:227 kDa spindle- and centromere-associated protein isoform X1 [Capsella rubella]|uniref:227 kDa spindle- and centromere-associated protein isoform X1 n=1 Tax=Capsella rubella TaxID=81985 RepID=UPI000CD4DE58|nr:227 kDa spindle- and centromere-associated protein isoform X1 [Capsella rubella]XP_023640110.1 227 kDa spindle- and centromere-associated protein isoform X1 [Capsella rubella]
MKKLFFFKSSSSSNGTDHKQPHKQKDDQFQQNLNSPKGYNKSQSGESGDAAAFRRSRSFSSAAFLIDGTSSNDATRSSQHRLRNHSSRCFTPDRQCKESASLSTCSSNVLDRYIDGEEHLERSKQKSGSPHSSLSGSRRGLPPRAQQSPSPLSDSGGKDKRKSKGLRDASARSLARSVIERLSHNTQGKSKALSYEPIRIQDVCGGYNGKTLVSNSDVLADLVVPLTEHYERVSEYYADDQAEQQHQQFLLHGKDMFMGTNGVCKEGDVCSELERRYKEAEKRVKLLSQELEEKKFLSGCDFDVSSLVGDIRQMEEERVGLAFEVLSLLRSQMDERASTREEIRRAKTDRDLHVKRLEKEKSELQVELEKEFDRRSGEFTSKLESFKLEEKRLRERVRELAEHNVSLQREISTFHEKETERIDMIRHLDETVTELSGTAGEFREENLYLMQNLTKLQESYTGSTDDLDCIRRNFEEKDMECKELHKSVTKLLRTCKEQEKTIEGLKESLSEEIKKQPSEHVDKKLQMEQIRLVGVELALRKEVESMKLEAESLVRENNCLLNHVKRNGEEADVTTFKLDNEMKMRVCQLQDQGLSMLNESTQLCYKLLKIIKEKLTQFPESYQSVNNGLSEQFLIESEMRVHGIRRGTESLKRSLQTVSSLLLEKSNDNSESSCSTSARPSEPNNQSVEKSLRAELRAETLVTSLLREKLYSKEEEIEQLQAEVAAGVRGNEVLQCEIQNTLDNLSVNNHQLKDLKLQMEKKDEIINRLEINLQEAVKDLATLPKVLEEREEMWKEVKECRKRNMDLESDKEMLKNKVEKLEEDTLFKEGQITILKDTLGSRHFDLLLSSPEFSYNDFLVQ